MPPKPAQASNMEHSDGLQKGSRQSRGFFSLLFRPGRRHNNTHSTENGPESESQDSYTGSPPPRILVIPVLADSVQRAPPAFPSPLHSPAPPSQSPFPSPSHSPSSLACQLMPSPTSSQHTLVEPRSNPPPSPPSFYSLPTTSIDPAYKTVDLDESHPTGLTPEHFYGALLSSNESPSEPLKRMADALFFYMDSSCEDSALRGSGVIEPAKYTWMLCKKGAPRQWADTVLQNIQSLFESGSVDYTFASSLSGVSLPVLDRKAWLQLVIFEIKVNPSDAHQFWSRLLSIFDLHDPATHTPFPKPLPRSAFPPIANHRARSAYESWKQNALRPLERPWTEAQQQQRQQTISAMYAQVGLADPMARFSQPSPTAQYMNVNPMGMGQYMNPGPTWPYSSPAMSYPGPAITNIFNGGPVQQPQGVRDNGNAGSNNGGGGGATEAFWNTASAALNLAGAVVGGAGGAGPNDPSSGMGFGQTDTSWDTGSAGGSFGNNAFGEGLGFGNNTFGWGTPAFGGGPW